MDSSIDSRIIADESVPGLTWHVQVFPDYEASPEDADCYTESQRRSWRADDWQYVGVLVTPLINGVKLSDCSDSLWGVEYGHYLCTDEDDNKKSRIWINLDSFITGSEGHEAYPVPDMISECKAQLIKAVGPMIDALRTAETALNAAWPMFPSLDSARAT